MFSTRGHELLTCTAAGATTAPDPPGLPSGCRSRYRAQSPTLGKKTRAARASATACRSRFSLRLIGAGQPRRAPPRPPRFARPPVRPAAAAVRPAEAAAAPASLQLRGTSAARRRGSRAPPLYRRRGVALQPCHFPAAHSTSCTSPPAEGYPKSLHPLMFHLLTEHLSSLGCTGARSLPIPPPRAAMVRPASQRLPARRSFAKVPELGSWALAVVAGHAIRTPQRTRVARHSPGSARTRYSLRRWVAAVHSSPGLCPGVQTRPAFDLRTPRNLFAEGTVRGSASGRVSFFLLGKLWSVGTGSPVWALCKTNKEVTGASL